jgi:hypothetical protein
VDRPRGDYTEIPRSPHRRKSSAKGTDAPPHTCTRPTRQTVLGSSVFKPANPMVLVSQLVEIFPPPACCYIPGVDFLLIEDRSRVCQ